MKKTQYILVDAISQFRIRYLVEVPEGKKEWALDTVTMEEAKEFSQFHLGETIIDHREVSKQEALDTYRKDNDYLAKWSDDQIVKSGFTLIKDYINAKTKS
jgi:hypothetical protein